MRGFSEYVKEHEYWIGEALALGTRDPMSGRSGPHHSEKKRIPFSDEELNIAGENMRKLWQIYRGVLNVRGKVGSNRDAIYNYMTQNNMPTHMDDDDDSKALMRISRILNGRINRTSLLPGPYALAYQLQQILIKKGEIEEPVDPKQAEAQQKMTLRLVTRWLDGIRDFTGTDENPKDLNDEDYKDFPTPYYYSDYHASGAAEDPKKIKFYQSPRGKAAYQSEVIDVACKATHNQLIGAIVKWWHMPSQRIFIHQNAPHMRCGISNDSLPGPAKDFLDKLNLTYQVLVNKAVERILNFTGHADYPKEGFRMNVAKWAVMRELYSRLTKAQKQQGTFNRPYQATVKPTEADADLKTTGSLYNYPGTYMKTTP